MMSKNEDGNLFSVALQRENLKGKIDREEDNFSNDAEPPDDDIEAGIVKMENNKAPQDRMEFKWS